jgi:hypothetical protein
MKHAVDTGAVGEAETVGDRADAFDDLEQMSERHHGNHVKLSCPTSFGPAYATNSGALASLPAHPTFGVASSSQTFF